MSALSLINSGYNGLVVSVECSLSRGLPNTSIVGLASKSVDESKERIRIAVNSSGYSYPKGRIVINLAPADLPKDSSSLDLAMALTVLEADGQVNKLGVNYIFIGELGLDGSIRAVRGIIGKLLSVKKSFNNPVVFIPKDNELQASMLADIVTYPAKNLKEVVDHLNKTKLLQQTRYNQINQITASNAQIDFSEIFGQDAAKRALLIAACGGHNILMSGPPGTGKSMLAKAFIGILPALDSKEALETTHIHSLSSLSYENVVTNPPLRSPHHTSSDVALIGGGHSLKPGEISLAHNGVLFLDELPEYKRSAIESLRQPLEDGNVTISRAQQSATYPSRFILIATSNPCPCGYLYSDTPCTCTPNEIHKYQKKLSGPLLDRIDIHINVGQIEHKNLLIKATSSESNKLCQVVKDTHKIQTSRHKKLNARLSNKELKSNLKLENDAQSLLNAAALNMKLSARSYIKTLKVARTIADIDKSDFIKSSHIAEALQYRPKIIKL